MYKKIGFGLDLAYRPYLAGISPREPHPDDAQYHAKITGRKIEDSLTLLALAHFVYFLKYI